MNGSIGNPSLHHTIYTGLVTPPPLPPPPTQLIQVVKLCGENLKLFVQDSDQVSVSPESTSEWTPSQA